MKFKLSIMKNGLQLFSIMYISCQARNGDIDVFFQHENHSWPPFLCINNMMGLGEKDELLKCWEQLAQRPQNTHDVDVKIFDRASLVHTLNPKFIVTNVKKFKDYAEGVFVSYHKRQLIHASQVDVVLGINKADSLKANIREGRDNGKVLRVSEKHKWKNFLCVDSNKTKSESTSPGKILVTLKSQNVASSTTLDVSCLQPCLQKKQITE